MKVVVNLQDSHQEKVLLAFLDSLEYQYQTEPDVEEVNAEQQQELNGVRSWDEIKKDLLNLFD